MKTNNKYTGRIFFLAALLLTTVVTGCSNNSDPGPLPSGTVPTVTETTPADIALAVALNSKVTATFSEAMDATTMDTTSFMVVGAGELELIGSVSLDATTNTASFIPGRNLTASTVYTATLSTQAKSSAGNALAADYVWSFTSGIIADTAAPTVSSTNPADAVTDFALNGSVTANFSEALDPTTVNSSTFSLSDAGTPVAGTVSYSNQVATFNPTSDLTASTLYTATLSTAITDLAANPLAANVVWSFTSGVAVDTIPPTVSSTSPVDAATGFVLNGSITANFSEALDLASVTTSTFTLSNGGTPVAGTVSYSNQVATFKPTSDLTGSTLYTATLTTGIKDIAANPLAANVVWGFTTGAIIAPTVSGTSPADSAINVALNSQVTATFSEAMDATTFDITSFTVIGAGEPALTGTVSLNATTNTASFTPGSNLTPSTVYSATLTTTVTNSAGTALAANVVWSFTTGILADTVAPTVNSTNPADTSTGFALNGNVSANFSEALAPATVNSTSFTLSNGGTPVAGTVSYNNKVATFNPTSDLTASTLYSATLTTAITDLAGPANSLAANVVWSFTTGAAVAVGPAPVNLRTAGDFVILTKTGITNVHSSAITGNVGASPITAAAMDNVFCTEIVGTIYGSDAGYTGSGAITCFAGASPDNTLVANAVLDMGTAYADAAGRTTPDFTELHAGDISGQTLVPGLYKWGTNVLINTDVTLSGGPNDVWIFQIAGDIIQANGSNVFLAGGALPKNIFWQVAGGTGVAIGTTAHFEGVVLATKGITVNTGASINGRLLSQTAVTLDQNAITQPAP